MFPLDRHLHAQGLRPHSTGGAAGHHVGPGPALPGEIGVAAIETPIGPTRGGITVIHGTLDPASDPIGYARLRRRGPTVAAIGKFDGIHRGHQALLSHTIAESRRRGLQAGAVTFDVHPAELLRDERRQYLTSLDERVEEFDAAGLEFVVLLRGTRDLFAMTAEEFAAALVTVLDCRVIVVGSNFRFGRGGTADTGTLRAVAQPLGAQAIALDLLPGFGEAVSSSRIRAAIRSGRVEHAADLLGRPFTIAGVVVEGERGRCTTTMAPNLVRPPAGRYAGWLEPVSEGGPRRAASIVIGEAPNLATILFTDPARLPVRSGDRIRVGFTRVISPATTHLHVSPGDAGRRWNAAETTQSR